MLYTTISEETAHSTVYHHQGIQLNELFLLRVLGPCAHVPRFDQNDLIHLSPVFTLCLKDGLHNTQAQGTLSGTRLLGDLQLPLKVGFLLPDFLQLKLSVTHLF